MGGKPFFSVIVPTHNGAEYMRKGLDSIRNQSFTDYELIVVADDCEDNTEEIAREYTDKVIITHYGRDGLARNAGLDAATGEWVLFMDDDDWWLHEFAFQLIRDVVGRNNEDVMTFSFIWKHKGYAQNWPRMWIAAWNKCWRRAFIGDTRFSDIPFTSDVDFYNGMMAKKPIIVNYDMPLYYYNYLRPGSQTEIHEGVK